MKKKTEKVNIPLKKKQVALLLDENFNLEVVVHEMANDDIITDNIIIIAAIANALKTGSEEIDKMVAEFISLMDKESNGKCKKTLH